MANGMKYEKYKDSGVEWIGEVPSHWEVCAFKRKITINNGKDYKDFTRLNLTFHLFLIRCCQFEQNTVMDF